ncbi:GNAT family N-acetyltransferase [Herbiconiux ginsengi]|uniref:Phosphinothricin acetyltransferase n=1 Tax=Herbiconiux ginsengi TaxID=381665 RepID=A0A1H3Q0A5_9MICO|nr:GNAT family N-acetyltransferase [Herbiconiux ginsengi]SDZ06663.1 phosphinothricin acetyltransferase [Herbiconiux ginsengi]
MTGVDIRRLLAADWPAVEAIYREGIATGNATFESEPPGWKSFDAGKIALPRLVATTASGGIVGWAAASRVSDREVYRGVIEHSVYVAESARGKGVGHALLEAFVAEAEAAGYWTIQSSIFPENAASLAVHERAGFRVVGTRRAIARMRDGPWAGQWRDTVLVEWRSSVIGWDRPL